MTKIKKVSASKTKDSLFDIDVDAPVLSFDASKYGVKKIPSNRRTSVKPTSDVTSLDLLNITANDDNDDDDDANAQISSILQRLQDQVCDAHVGGLSGKQRKKHQIEKAVRLGAVAPKAVHMPTNMRVGMAAKAKERQWKEKMAMREQEHVGLVRAVASRQKRDQFKEAHKRRRKESSLNLTRDPNIRKLLSS